VEILKIGHHGSRTASSRDFLAITSPEVAVYMAKEGNSYGHPHQETIDALNEIGAAIHGTDFSGNIVLTSDGETYDSQTER
jgi:competence protein ComEC